MWQVIRRNPFAAFLALILHLALLAWLIFGIEWQAGTPPSKPQVETVQARVVDAEKIKAEVEKLRAAEAKKEAEKEAAHQREEKRLAELKRRQAEEKQRLADLEKKRKAKEKAAAERRAEEKKRKDQEVRRLAELKQQKAELEKKRRAQEKRLAEAERKRKAEDARRRAEDKKRKQAEAKARELAETKRKAEAEARARAEQKAREDALQAQITAEQDARERNRYVAAIKQQIENNWLRPPSAGANLRCTLRVRLIPGGDVIAVSVIDSSGNAAFDRSVETAVRKAAPLPVPSGSLFESFRDLKLVFDPGK